MSLTVALGSSAGDGTGVVAGSTESRRNVPLDPALVAASEVAAPASRVNPALLNAPALGQDVGEIERGAQKHQTRLMFFDPPLSFLCPTEPQRTDLHCHGGDRHGAKPCSHCPSRHGALAEAVPWMSAVHPRMAGPSSGAGSDAFTHRRCRCLMRSISSAPARGYRHCCRAAAGISTTFSALIGGCAGVRPISLRIVISL